MSNTIDETDGPLLADCRRLLAAYEDRYRDQPEEQYRRLCLLALEREQLVSFAYREDVLGRRLEACRGDRAVIELFRHALLQLWRDEEAHTVYIRGELVKDEAPARTVKVLAEQGAGLLSGWSSALRHHVPRSAAPIRTALVDGLALGARAAGRLSPDLRAELAYKTVRDYCRYNVDAERTAELCWRRLIQLDEQLGYDNKAPFTRIAREEDEHRQVFALIADCLDDEDRVVPGHDAATVHDQLAAIDSRMVPPARRPRGPGSGGLVHVLDRRDGTKTAALNELLDREIPDLSGARVAIKASWMLGYSVDDPTTITDPALLASLVARLRGAGAASVVLLDGPNLYNDLFHNREVERVAAHFGLDEVGCPVADTDDDVVPIADPIVFGPSHINRPWAEADIRISITRLRSHPTEHAHLTMANAEGLIRESCQSVFWNRTYQYSAASLAVGMTAPPNLAIVDAWDDCPDGWFGVMAGARPKHPGRLYGGADPLAVDLVVLRHTGSVDTIDSPTLQRAIEWFGDPRPSTTVVGEDGPIIHWRNPYRNTASALLADASYPVYAWLSRRGALFSPPMDAPFTEKRPLRAPLAQFRRVARRLLGLRPPDDR